MRRSRVAAAVVVLLSLGPGLGACGGSDGGDPGEVLDTESVDLGGGVSALRIRYGSVDVGGGRSDVSALVVVPGGSPPPGGWPVVAWAHSTTGVADGCAPSEHPRFGGVGGILTALASEGFVAVATDYEGVGTDGDHPYLDGPSEARSVVDSVRAVRSVVPAGGVSTTWAVAGHSQGGHAAAFVAELGPGLAPELTLVGAVAMAPVTEPHALLIQPDAVVLLAAGYLATDPDVDTDELLTPLGRTAVDAAVDDGCEVRGPPLDGPLLAVEDDAGFVGFLERNTIARSATTVPVLVQQGRDDQLTKPDAARRAVDRWCALGVTVELRDYAADHGTIVERAFGEHVTWLRDRFAGVAPGTSC